MDQQPSSDNPKIAIIHKNQPSPKLISSSATLPLSSSLSLPTDHQQSFNEKQYVFCICTGCSFFWLLLSLFTWVLAVSGSLSPNWINKSINEVYIAFDNLHLPFATQHHYFQNQPFLTERSTDSSLLRSPLLIPDVRNEWHSPVSSSPIMLISSLGPFGGCAGLLSALDTWPTGCEPRMRRILQFADRVQPLWHASQIALLLGLTVYMIAMIGSLVGSCKQSIHQKSLFTITGTIQAFAGLFYMLGLILYVAGLGDPLSKSLCTTSADPFWLGNCSLGTGFVVAVAANFLMFICSLLSLRVEQSTSSDRVQNEILNGRQCVCLC